MPKSIIKKLQQLQNDHLNGQQLSQLPQNEQIAFYQTNKEIAELAYQAYEQMKHDSSKALEAAHYFVLSVNQNNVKAIHVLKKVPFDCDPDKSVRHVKPLETAEETFYLGICHLLGIANYVQNNQIAFELIYSSASKNCLNAIYYLGRMYDNGHGIPKDQKKAAQWFLLAAEQGLSRAQFNLGWMYYNGDGVTKDQEKAAEWFLLAAEQGHSSAQFNLGVMYDDGDGVTKDQEKATKWYRLAAEQGHSSAQFNLGVMYDDGDGVTKDKKKAAKWYRLAAEQGDSDAQFNLGVMYKNGYGVPKDQAEAAEWYRLAAEQNFQKAIKKLSEMKNFSAMYHAAMLEMDESKVVKLLSGKKSTSEELMFDIRRCLKNDMLFDSILRIVHQLKEKGMNTDDYQSAINNLCIQRVLESHQEKNIRFELYDDKALNSLYNALASINFSNVAPEQVQPLFQLLIDSWYIATGDQISGNTQVTSKTAIYLSQLIHKLSGQTDSVIDSHTALQCQTILIKHYFGKQYEVAFRSPGLNELNLFLALIKSKKSVEQINQIVGENVIIEVNFRTDLIKSVVTQLTGYLKSHPETVSTSPYLASLNRCLIESAENLNDEHCLRNIMEKILDSISEYQSAKKAMRNNGFLATKGDEAKKIYSLLKDKDINGLQQFLEEHNKKSSLPFDEASPDKEKNIAPTSRLFGKQNEEEKKNKGKKRKRDESPVSEEKEKKKLKIS